MLKGWGPTLGTDRVWNSRPDPTCGLPVSPFPINAPVQPPGAQVREN